MYVTATSANLESGLELLNADSSIDSLESQTGISGITLEFVYLNPDGSDVFRKSYTK